MTSCRFLRRQLGRAQAGQTLVFFALATTVLLGMLGLVIDLGYEFGQRRTMQNAADAAALAGAKAVKVNNQTAMPILQTVTQTAERSGYRAGGVLTCKYIKNDYHLTGAVYGDCDSTNPVANDITGVRVTASETHDTFFMRVLGITTSGTSATAVARVEVIVAATGPYIVCGIQTKYEDQNVYGNILETLDALSDYQYKHGTDTYLATKESPKIKDAAYHWVPASSGGTATAVPGFVESTRSGRPVKPYLIHAPGGTGKRVAQCTADSSSSFTGKNETIGKIDLKPNGLMGVQTVVPPSPTVTTMNLYGATVKAGTGVSAGVVMEPIAGVSGCANGQTKNCVMVLPIADNSVKGTTGTNALLGVRTFGAFYVTANTSENEHYGFLIEDYITIGATNAVYDGTYSGPVSIRLLR